MVDDESTHMDAVVSYMHADMVVVVVMVVSVRQEAG
jgi:hypothetical protein